MSFENGFAILIAVDDNTVEKWALPDVKKDIAALSQVLNHPERCGFPAENMRVLSGKHATREGILNALEWLKDRIDKDESNTTAIVYYSGHGWRDEKADPPEYYLIPYDVFEKEIGASALKAGDFAAKVEMLRPRRLLVIFDCCHSAGMGVKDLTESSSFVPFAMPTHLIMKEKPSQLLQGQKHWKSSNKDMVVQCLALPVANNYPICEKTAK